ncbi:kinesin-like protein, putative [Plasmodium gallinaceum]|uniref:Kinesin-like protein, putative n=1 Tax=Plasmodium gallinaceum TaxID=5849 RepID=A0A1J1GUC0_PLAGA|nr:kinesin-like protein, putative [Plasmodium gallinaceum]CRG95897.1 kinesin-like protein, putative [Plasmodium gallinaceum]
MDLNKNNDRNNINLGELQVESSSKEEAIRVCTRIRPLFEKEVNRGHLKAWKMNKTDMHLIVEPPSMTEMLNARDPKKGNKKEFKKNVEKTEGQKAVIQRYYAFDRCFDDFVGNEEVYKHLARDIILDTFKGINGCILAYGQTGSGKTHSVMGVPSDPGMLPRSLAEFFNGIENPSTLNEDNASIKSGNSNNNTKEFLMSVTYLEVYMERVNDLLQEGYRGVAENLDVKEDPKRGFVVIGIQEETVTSIDEVMLLVAKAEQRRHIAQTNFNETSSRSHTIFTVILESNQVLNDGTSINKRGELKIVDLAGNERAGRASEGIENAKTVLEEGKAINKSLFVLSEVISKLSKRAQAIAFGDEKKIKKIQEDLVFIPWRDSKLTRILSKSLGGNCRASVIVAVHPSHLYLDTSFSTLRFALKCKTIKKKIEVNYLSPEQSVIMQQKELIAKLQNQLKHLATSKNADVQLLGSDKKYIPRRPEDDEKIMALKNELEEKVKKFQNFILKSEFHVNSSNYRTLRSMDANTEKSLKYSMTISPNMKNELNWLRSFDTHEYDTKWDGIEKYEDHNVQEKLNISKAMDYLKNKSPYKLNSSEISDVLSSDFQKDDSISLNYYNELDELEKLEKIELNKKQKKEKGDINNKMSNKEFDELSKLSFVKNSHLNENKDVEFKGKEFNKIKKKKVKRNNYFYNKDTEAFKKYDKLKMKNKSTKLKKKKNNKYKKETLDKHIMQKKIEEETDHVSLSTYKDEDSIVKEADKKPYDTNFPEIDSANLSQPKEQDNNKKRTSIISNLKEKIEDDLKKKKKIISRNVELNKQIKFIMKLMQKVGLSAILTGTVPPGRNIENVLKLQENLKDDLKLYENKILLDMPNGKTNNEDISNDYSKNGNNIESLLNYTLGEGNEAEYAETLSHIFINEMFFTFILRIQQKNSNDESLKNIGDLLKNEDNSYDLSKKALEDILGCSISNKVDKLEEINPIKSIKDEKSKKVIDSILNMLTPWEQKILALLYEQQKMRQNIQKMKEKFSQRIQNINVFIKKILIDKIEVEKHLNRVLKTIEEYKNDLIKTSDVDSNFKFAGLMKKLEEMSILLAEKTRDFNVLADFHLNLRKSVEQKDNLIKELQEENKLFYLVPKYNELLQELNEQNNEEAKELKKEFLLIYGRLMLVKKKLHEKDVIENDMRNLNIKIYTELIESISVIKNLESQNKFLEFKLNMENKRKMEKIKKLLNEKQRLNKVINEMEKLLENANIDTSGLKDEIFANYNSSNTNTECENDEYEKELKEDVDKRKKKTKNENLKKKKELNDNIHKEKIQKKKKAKKENFVNSTEKNEKKIIKKVDLNLRKKNIKIPTEKNNLNEDNLNLNSNLSEKKSKLATNKKKTILDDEIKKKNIIKKKKIDGYLEKEKNINELKLNINVKKKKKGLTGKKMNLLENLKKESKKENMETVLSEGNENLLDSNDNSATDYETNEVRHILNMEIEKKATR